MAEILLSQASWPFSPHQYSSRSGGDIECDQPDAVICTINLTLTGILRLRSDFFALQLNPSVIRSNHASIARSFYLKIREYVPHRAEASRLIFYRSLHGISVDNRSEFIGGLIFFQQWRTGKMPQRRHSAAPVSFALVLATRLRCPSSIQNDDMSGLVLTHSGSFVAELNFWIRVKLYVLYQSQSASPASARMSPSLWPLSSFPASSPPGGKSAAELPFKIHTVRHHHNTTQLQAVAKNQRFAEEHHGV